MNPVVDRFPAIVAQCANEDDVLRCIDFSHQQKLEIAVRSGNQSFLGWGTCNNGIVVDLSRMKSVKVDAVQGTVHAGTGNTAQEILAATAPYSLAPILGQCGGVGAGLALGGGLGWLSGQFGATCDNLMSARLITADGRTLTADSTTNPDLFWAIRGAGGNFCRFRKF
jgi:FAD/FMN-containing dehydrogenase